MLWFCGPQSYCICFFVFFSVYITRCPKRTCTQMWRDRERRNTYDLEVQTRRNSGGVVPEPTPPQIGEMDVPKIRDFTSFFKDVQQVHIGHTCCMSTLCGLWFKFTLPGHTCCMSTLCGLWFKFTLAKKVYDEEILWLYFS